MKKYLKLKYLHYFFLFASLGDTTKKRENIDPVNYSQIFFFILFGRSLFLSRVNIYIWCVMMLPITYRAIRMCTISDVKTEKK